jgi:hypothetical protein
MSLAFVRRDFDERDILIRRGGANVAAAVVDDSNPARSSTLDVLARR